MRAIVRAAGQLLVCSALLVALAAGLSFLVNT
jgi:hypothetical protein